MAAEPCELCEAAPLTEWFHSDELCWIAECESCSVPMVVWRLHDPDPSPEVRAELHLRLLRTVAEHFEVDAQRIVETVWIDDHLRSIPTHYHAHARSRGGPFGAPLSRRRMAADHPGASQ